jgi:hypothetical protein
VKLSYRQLVFYGIATLLPGILLAGHPVAAHAQQPTQALPRALISIYRIAPGKHLDFLKWIAQREALAREAGDAATQWYAHENGDSWDYIAIGPVPTDQQDQKTDAVTKQRGLSTGFAASLEFRQFVSFHTDTYARGPTTAADLVSLAGRR